MYRCAITTTSPWRSRRGAAGRLAGVAGWEILKIFYIIIRITFHYLDSINKSTQILRICLHIVSNSKSYRPFGQPDRPACPRRGKAGQPSIPLCIA